jgi:hypothetical protein
MGDEQSTEGKERAEDDTDVNAFFFLPGRDRDGEDLTGLIEEFIAGIYPEFNWSYLGVSVGTWPAENGEMEFDACARYFVLTKASKIETLKSYIVERFKNKTKQEKILFFSFPVNLHLL